MNCGSLNTNRQKILQGADMSLSELNVFYNETVTLQLMDNIFPKMETNMFIVFVDCVKYLLFPINGVLIIIGLGQLTKRNHNFLLMLSY